MLVNHSVSKENSWYWGMCYKRRVALFVVCYLVLTSVVYLLFNWSTRFPEIQHSQEPETWTKFNAEATKHVKQRPKKILYWGYYGARKWREQNWPIGAISCSQDVECVLTDDASEYTASDAVILHGAQATRTRGLPPASKRPPNQAWVFLTQESPLHAGSFYKDKNIINFTMTYMLKSDVLLRYGDIEHKGAYMGGFNASKDYLKDKTKSVVTMVSNCGQKQRLKHIRALSKWIDVDIFGKCGSNIVCHDCWDTFQPYKFYLAYENSICVDYVTEKLYDAGLSHGMVPVVLGGANYSSPSVAPPGGYIDARNFTTVKELADFLKKVGSDPNLYGQYFHWHSGYRVRMRSYQERLCNLCKLLHQNGSSKVYEDVIEWYRTAGHCEPYPPVISSCNSVTVNDDVLYNVVLPILYYYILYTYL